MTKVLVVYRDTAREALEHLDDFNSKMQTFIETHPEFSYTSTLKKDENRWKIKVTVNEE